jgi:hypothetical protein
MGRRAKLEILESVIRVVPVDVMNLFVAAKRPTQGKCHHQSVLRYVSPMITHRCREMSVILHIN